MEIKEYLQKQVADAHGLLDAAITDTSNAMANTKTGGEHTNIIATVYAHVIGREDYFVQTTIQDKPSLWESGWAERLSINAQLARNWTFAIPDLSAFRAYAQAVHAATDAYLKSATPEELDLIVQVFGSERPVANVLMTIVTHASGHAGEIATLKGMQGVKGLPF